MTDDTTAVVKALDRVSDELRGVRLAIEACGAPAAGESDPMPVACAHPDDRRIDFGVTNGIDDFQCEACGFRSVPVATNA